MEKRIRSPNYPALSLPDALDKVAVLYRAQHLHSAPREVIAKHIGYQSLNGASATTISAIHKYGLLEPADDGFKVSQRALRILHPESDAEKTAAIMEAAREPQLFAELDERFRGAPPSDDLLRNYLIRRGFAPGALGSVISAYRETSELVERQKPAHDSPHGQPHQEHAAMTEPATPSAPLTPTQRPAPAAAVAWPDASTMNVSLTEGGIKVEATLVDARGIDRLIKALQINKILLEPIPDDADMTTGADKPEEY